MKEKPYQMCTRCVMDTTDPDIVFDENGVCNHCIEAMNKIKEFQYPTYFSEKFYEIGKKIKAESNKKKYNCIIGLSGGVDSSYVAYLAVKKLRLNPLCVHFDNGWNTDIAIKNIENVVTKLNIDLETYVIDWEEFKKLQRAFLKASVIDLELVTDQAHKAAIYKIARQNKIKFNITGGNYVTEHGMPASWYWSTKQDVRNIKDIGKRFENITIKNYPTLGLIKFKFLNKFNFTYSSIPILNYINYRRKDAITILENELNWINYGGKHQESFITKFFQEYILPTKFNVDKRRVHYSALIRNGEISRIDALKILQIPPYDPETIESEIEYFLKKIQLSREEFETIMNQKEIPHRFYKSDLDFLDIFIKLKSYINKKT